MPKPAPFPLPMAPLTHAWDEARAVWAIHPSRSHEPTALTPEQAATRRRYEDLWAGPPPLRWQLTRDERRLRSLLRDLRDLFS